MAGIQFDPTTLLLPATLIQALAGAALVIMVWRIPEQPGRKLALSLSGVMAWLPLVWLQLGLVVPPLAPLLLVLCPIIALSLVEVLVRMQQWPAVWAAWVGFLGALIGTWGWVCVACDL